MRLEVRVVVTLLILISISGCLGTKETVKENATFDFHIGHTSSHGWVGFPHEFIATAQDPDDAIILYEWDFEGDGNFDWNSTQSGDTNHTYFLAGEYFVELRVTDNDQMTISKKKIIDIVEIEKTDSEINFSVNIGNLNETSKRIEVTGVVEITGELSIEDDNDLLLMSISFADYNWTEVESYNFTIDDQFNYSFWNYSFNSLLLPNGRYHFLWSIETEKNGPSVFIGNDFYIKN